MDGPCPGQLHGKHLQHSKYELWINRLCTRIMRDSLAAEIGVLNGGKLGEGHGEQVSWHAGKQFLPALSHRVHTMPSACIPLTDLTRHHVIATFAY